MAKRKKRPPLPVSPYPMAPRPLGLDWLELPVRHPAISAAVYEALGFQRRRPVRGWPLLSVGGLSLVLRPIGSCGSTQTELGLVLQIAVDDVQTLRRKMIALGLHPRPIRRQSRGDLAFTWTDPDGHTMRFVGARREPA